MFRYIAFAFAFLLIGVHAAGAADCTNPVKAEGTIIYNTTYRVMQYCNGTDWVNMGAAVVNAGGGSIANIDSCAFGEAPAIYNGRLYCSSGITPSGLSFVDVMTPDTSTLVESNSVTISGLGEGGAPVSIEDDGHGTGAYRINSGSWLSGASEASNGDVVQLRLTSPLVSGEVRAVTLTVGAVARGWSVMTAMESCTLYADAGFPMPGIYTVDPDGSGPAASYEAWCPPTAPILASDGAGGDNFGRSVSLSGGLALVGAYYDDDNGSNSGSAYVYDVSTPSSPVEVAKLTASDGAGGDYFGWSVSLSGGLALVGAPYDDDNGSYSGSAYLFGE
jgi:hypothetical protein